MNQDELMARGLDPIDKETAIKAIAMVMQRKGITLFELSQAL